MRDMYHILKKNQLQMLEGEQSGIQDLQKTLP